MLQHLFSASAISHAGKAAVVGDDARLTYAELQAEALRLARALRSSGASPGDRVAMIIANSAKAAVTAWGIWEAGCVWVPLHANARPDALQTMLADCEARWVVSGSELAPMLAKVPFVQRADRLFLWAAKPGAAVPSVFNAERTTLLQLQSGQPQPGQLEPGVAADGASEEASVATGEESQLAALVYTSGSTGEPKGVMLTHANMRAALKSVNAYLRWEASDVVYSPLPLGSSYGLYQLVMGLAVGATVVLDRSFAFPARGLSLVVTEKATVFAGVPTMYAWLVGSGALGAHDLRSLRMMTSAAAALPIEHGRRIRESLPGMKLFVMYGMTECKRISYLEPEDFERKPGSVGRGIPFQEHAIVDESGERVAVGEIGELVVRGEHVMQGYWKSPEQTARKIRPISGSAEPWLHTDDLFRCDEDGYLYFMGRRDDLLKVGGHKVSPRDVEDVLCRMPQIREAAVIGAPDPNWGEVVRAYVVPQGAVTADEVIRFCTSRMQGFMVPRSVVFVDELPKTDSGKVRKRDLATVRPIDQASGS